MSWWEKLRKKSDDPAHFVVDYNGQRVNWVEKYPRALSPLRGNDEQIKTQITDIIRKMNDVGVRDNDDVIRNNLNAARAFLIDYDAHKSQTKANISGSDADLVATYTDFRAKPHDLFISNAITDGRSDGEFVYINWNSPNTGRMYTLKIKIPAHLRRGGKSKRVKRTKTCKSKRSKRSKTCKNRVHKRRN